MRDKQASPVGTTNMVLKRRCKVWLASPSLKSCLVQCFESSFPLLQCQALEYFLSFGMNVWFIMVCFTSSFQHLRRYRQALGHRHHRRPRRPSFRLRDLQVGTSGNRIALVQLAWGYLASCPWAIWSLGIRQQPKGSLWRRIGLKKKVRVFFKRKAKHFEVGYLLCGLFKWITVLSSLNMLTSSMSWRDCMPNFLMVDLSFLSSLTSLWWTTFLVLLWVPMLN